MINPRPQINPGPLMILKTRSTQNHSNLMIMLQIFVIHQQSQASCMYACVKPKTSNLHMRVCNCLQQSSIQLAPWYIIYQVNLIFFLESGTLKNVRLHQSYFFQIRHLVFFLLHFFSNQESCNLKTEEAMLHLLF